MLSAENQPVTESDRAPLAILTRTPRQDQIPRARIVLGPDRVGGALPPACAFGPKPGPVRSDQVARRPYGTNLVPMPFLRFAEDSSRWPRRPSRGGRVDERAVAAIDGRAAAERLHAAPAGAGLVCLCAQESCSVQTEHDSCAGEHAGRCPSLAALTSTFGPSDLRTLRPLDLWTFGPRTSGPLDPWTFGPLDPQTPGPAPQR
jgi:hypothetical protein